MHRLSPYAAFAGPSSDLRTILSVIAVHPYLGLQPVFCSHRFVDDALVRQINFIKPERAVTNKHRREIWGRLNFLPSSPLRILMHLAFGGRRTVSACPHVGVRAAMLYAVGRR
jgi:hypothetical protein